MARALCPGPVIPAVRSKADFGLALKSKAPGIILLFGDILALPALLEGAAAGGKKLIVHLDLLEGIGRDKAGIRFLARMGVEAVISTKPQLLKAAQEEEMTAIQRLFMMDSETLKNGVKILRNARPDAVEILPASVPSFVFQEVARETRLPVFAGGLVQSADDVRRALESGAFAVSTSKTSLW